MAENAFLTLVKIPGNCPLMVSAGSATARARRQVNPWTSSERNIALSNGQAEFYDEDEAGRRFEAALRGARTTGHKLKTDIPKKRPESQAARKQDL